MISMSCVRVKALLLCLLLPVFSLRVQAEAFCKGDVPEKVIALTFDDGPHHKYTEKILDILKQHKVKATFFTIGTNVERFPELVEREMAEGHEVANHTYSHKHMAKMTNEELASEILGWQDVMYDHHEHSTKLFRPPEGVVVGEEQAVIEELGYDVILWSIDTRDWAHTPVNTIVKNVTENVQNGSIVLFHDFVSGESPTPEALEILIPKLKEMGYSFVTVSELIK